MKKLRIAILALSVVALGGLTACDDGAKANNPAKPEAKKTPSVGEKPDGSGSKKVVDPALIESMDMLAILNRMANKADLAASGCETKLEAVFQKSFDFNLKRITGEVGETEKDFENGILGVKMQIEKAGETDRYCQLGYIAEAAQTTINTYAVETSAGIGEELVNPEQTMEKRRARRKAVAQGLYPLYVEANKMVRYVEEEKSAQQTLEDIETTKDSIETSISVIVSSVAVLEAQMECKTGTVPSGPFAGQTYDSCSYEKAKMQLAQESIEKAKADVEAIESNSKMKETAARNLIRLEMLQKVESEVKVQADALTQMVHNKTSVTNENKQNSNTPW